jgi:AraC-like DNA-binding protein
MTQTGRYFAISPASEGSPVGVAGPDVLSTMLHSVHLQGNALTRLAPAAPFAITTAGGTRLLHLVEHGPLRLRVGDAPEVTLGSGDLALLCRGDTHTLRSDHEGPGEAPRWLTGTFVVEDTVAGPLLAVLPPVIVIRADPRTRDWLVISLKLLLDEADTPRPGSAVMISRVLDLLFIHALREWSASGDAAPGWLTAAMDPALGPVLTAVHADPGRAWSVTELAARAGMSRSAFAGRFARLLDETPAAYVAHVRLDHAAHLLTFTRQSVSQIGRQAGYISDAAFSRAFTRRHGSPPRTWRRDAATPDA